MNNIITNTNYDLEDRTLEFGRRLIKLCKQIKLSFVNKNIIEQLLRAGCSVGANYHEANGSVSRRDFRSKIGICKKEAKETNYWLNLLFYDQRGNSNIAMKIKELIKESHEFILIFSKVLRSSRSS